MKKLLSMIAFCLLSLSHVNGQAYFLFQGNTKSIWENFTTGEGPIVLAPSGTVNLAFLIGTGTPLIGMSGSPTNIDVWDSMLGNAWNKLLSDPNYHLAVNASTSQTAIVPSGASGSFSYNSGFSFPVAGTVTNTTYNVIVIGWNNSFGATPSAAAAATGLVGWSNTFQFTAGASFDVLFNFSQSGMQPFGLVIPEPSILSLASIGTLALAAFRRRK